jgi:replicative DNA helicase
MSSIKDETIAEIERVAKLANLKAENEAKKAVLDNKVYSSKLEQIQQNERDVESAKNANYGALSQEDVASIVKDNDDYLEAAQDSMPFICSAFDKMVPFFRKNVILIAGKTGHGKSAVVANLAYNLIKGRNKTTGKTRRVLVITNEEKREDFYNRVTAQNKGWHYANHSDFTPEQRKEFSKMIPILSSGGRLTVIDDGHGGSHGVTSSIEGIEAIFNNLIEKKEYYDVVIIDYYQNVCTSKKNPSLGMYQVQEKLSKLLDHFKNIYPAPIVLMSQLRPEAEKDMPFQLRIMGSKSIMVPATFAIEMIIDSKNLRTRWIVHKSRYAGSLGKDFWTGYDNGKFIEYTTAFAEKVQKMAYEKEARKVNNVIDQTNGIKDALDRKSTRLNSSHP